MRLYDQLPTRYQEWVEDAWEICENAAEQTYCRQISWCALALAALRKASPDIGDAFSRHARDGIRLDDYREYLENSVQTQDYHATPFEGEDGEFDGDARAWISALTKASGNEAEAWLLLLRVSRPELLQDFGDFFDLPKLQQQLENLNVDVDALAETLFTGPAQELNRALLTREAAAVLEHAALKAAEGAMDFVLPVHLLAAILHAGNALTEKLIRRYLPPRTPFTGFRDYVDSYAPVRRESATALPLEQARFADYSLAKLRAALSCMTRRGDRQMTVLDLLAGLLSQEEAHGQTIQAFFENHQIDFPRLNNEVSRLALSPGDNTDDMPAMIPEALAGSDLSWLAAKDKLPERKGFEKLADSVLRVLFKSRRNSVLLLGQRGTGRTAFLEELAGTMNRQRMKDLPAKKLIRLDCSSISPHGKATFLNDALQFGYGKKDVVLCLDGLEHIFAGEGTETKSTLQFLEQFQFAVQKTTLQFLITITPGAYHTSFKQDFRLQKLFETFTMEEPGAELTREILLEKIPEWNRRFGMTITPGAVEKAIHLTEQYMLSEYFPQKAIEVIEEAADNRTLERGLGDDEIRIGADDVIAVVSGLTAIPEETLRGDTGDSNYEKPLGERVVGQPEAVGFSAGELSLIKSGMKDPEKPASVMLFAGMTGTGKTELAKTIARMYSATKRLVTFTMANFTEAHSISGLIGVPPGYVGAELGGPLINEINKDPYCVVLLDEIEKAHPEIWKPFLNLFDEGWIVDKINVRAYANRSIFILTSNVGAEEASALYAQGASYETIAKTVKAALYKYQHPETRMPVFTPEFLARIQKIVVFRPLNEDGLRRILDIQLAKKNEQFQKARNKTLDVKEAARSALTAECWQRYDESKGLEGGRVVLKVMVEYIDRLIQQCDPRDFQEATLLEIDGENVAELTLKLQQREMTGGEAMDNLHKLFQASRGDYEVKLEEIINTFNLQSSRYRDALDGKPPQISEADKKALLHHYHQLMQQKQDTVSSSGKNKQ